MSIVAEEEGFVDGLTEDLITDLSRTRQLFVIARNSSFAWKGKHVDIRDIARSLGVRYALEGSARRVVGRVRINVQLIDATTGGHLWAERFDRTLDDIFALQDEVVAKIVEALVGRLTMAQLSERRRPTNLEAYDLCVRGRALVMTSADAAREAQLLLQRAITLDPGYAEAYSWLALSLWATPAFGGEPTKADAQLALTTVQKAIAIDRDDPVAYWMLGTLLPDFRQWDEAEEAFATALRLDPNNADAWAMLSELMVLNGRAVDAIESVQKAFRLNPHAPAWYHWFLGQAQYLHRQYERAVTTLRNDATYRTISRRTLAAALAQLGRVDEAKREAALFMANNPRFTIDAWVESTPFRDKAAEQHFVDGYLKAGLPE